MKYMENASCFSIIITKVIIMMIILAYIFSIILFPLYSNRVTKQIKDITNHTTKDGNKTFKLRNIKENIRKRKVDMKKNSIAIKQQQESNWKPVPPFVFHPNDKRECLKSARAVLILYPCLTTPLFCSNDSIIIIYMEV